MKTLYLDIFSGISGDMFLGALLDLGVDLHQLEHELAKLSLNGYHVHAARQQKSNIEGVKFDVHLEADPHPHDHGHADHAHEDHNHNHDHDHDRGHDHDHDHGHVHADHDHPHPHAHEHHPADHDHGHAHEHEHVHSEHAHGRNFADIKHLIASSGLSPWVKEKAIRVFQRVAVAEGKIHGHPPDEVHFHEVGAVDSIVDIVGACAGLELLGKPRVLAAPVVEGRGWVDCAHGRFPVPTTATLEILGARGIALTQCDEPHELVTPTGAALLAEFVEKFGPMDNLVASRIGYGLGTRDLASRPNVLRAVLGESPAAAPASGHDWETDRIAVLETNLDDLNPEVLGHFIEQALGAGALDVFHTPVQMKKNRPGVLLSLLCPVNEADRFSELILRETSAFGVRRTVAERRKLRREFTKLTLPYGEVTLKIGTLNGEILQAAPEFESCKALAARAKVPLKQVYEAALHEIHRHSRTK